MSVRTQGLAVIGVPSSAGARRTGLERAPAAFRAAGLVARLEALGLDLEDTGDLPLARFSPDLEHPRRQNLEPVLEVTRQVADRVEEVAARGRVPLLLGGDCSLSLGVVSGLLRHGCRPGLLYFDGDVDLNTPETTPSGAFDGMVIAHLLGRGVPELAGIGPRRPLLSEDDVVLFGYDESSGWIDATELEELAVSKMGKFSLARVSENPESASRQALAALEGGPDALIVHFDVDVTDIAAADVPHPGGLDVESAFAALEVLIQAPECAAIVVAELNPERDADGAHTARVVDGLVAALAGA